MRKVSYLLFCLLFLASQLPASEDPNSALCLTISPESDTLWVCEGGSIQLSVAGGSGSGYTWTPSEGIDNPDTSHVTLTPVQSQWYYVQDDSTCTDSVFIAINSEMHTFEVMVSTTDTICPLDPVNVSFNADGPIDSVRWEPEEGVVDPNAVAGTDLMLRVTTEYIVTAYIMGCEVSDTFEVDVVPFRFELVSDDTIYLCLPDTGMISHTLLPLAVNVVWEPLDTTITVIQPQTARVYPTVSATYTATATFEECVLTTTTFVRVDSLPDTVLTVIPVRDPYCAGEQVTIFAEFADTFKYPDIEFEWFPMDGQIQDSTNTGNVFVTLQDTTTFLRVMTQNACIDTSRITLNVIPPDIPLSVEDTTLCPGDMFMVEILDPDVTDIEWSPTEGLSCSDCPNPKVTVQDIDMLYMVMGKKDRCTVSGMLNVRVGGDYTIPITPSVVEVCPGDEVQFSIDFTGLTNVQVSLTGQGELSCTDCPDPVVTYLGSSPVQLVVTADESFDEFCGATGEAEIFMKQDSIGEVYTEIVCANEPTVIDLSGYGFVNPVLSISGGDLSCTNCTNPTVNVSENETLTVTSESPDGNSCFVIDRIQLTVYSGDEVSFGLDPGGEFGAGDVVSVTLNTIPMGGSDFSWFVNNSGVPGNTATVDVSLNEGDNSVKVTWVNSEGCMQMADTTLGASPPQYRIPKAFTPGKETNSHFKVEITGNYEIEEMLVFNRWGQVVYEGTDPEGWDGRRDGEAAPAEVYVYLIRMRYPDDRTVIEKGDVTLIR